MSELDPWANLTIDADVRLVNLSAPVEFIPLGPPPTQWVQVSDVPTVVHRRCCGMRPDGSPHFDLRAVSEVYEDAGSSWINLVPEPDWYAWCFIPAEERPGRPGKATPWYARYVWVELEVPSQLPE